MKVRNTTIQNRTKRARLDSDRVIPAHYVDSPAVVRFLRSLQPLDVPTDQLLFSIGCELTDDIDNAALSAMKKECGIARIDVRDVPHGEFDLLGSVYQLLSSKTEKLRRGIFYTGSQIARDFVDDLDFSAAQTIFDPACGSGAFLFRSSAGPDQVAGVDVDPIAVMLAKFNFFIKFPRADAPNIVCADFLSWHLDFEDERFDYVIGNPPYGADLDLTGFPVAKVTSGESFSLFLEFASKHRRRDGLLRFLVPESLLNVARHADVRSFLLENENFVRIKKYRSSFSGVMSDVCMVELDSGSSDSVLFDGDAPVAVPKGVLEALPNRVLVRLRSDDVSVLEKVEHARRFDLSESTFGLGVVTGNNAVLLSDECLPGMEPIITGKDVSRYRLATASRFINFDRSRLQQVAPDHVYRAREKLVYKTICKDLRFAIDAQQMLTTNSANILIPRLPGYDLRSVLAILNSDLFSFVHSRMFGGVNKVAKRNLLKLPFPELSTAQDARLAELASAAIEDGNEDEVQEYVTRGIFRLTEPEASAVRSAFEAAQR